MPSDQDHYSDIQDHLEKKWTRQRVPKGFYKACSEASATAQGSQPSKDRIFYAEGGFATWLSLFLATRKVRDAKGIRKQVMEAFQALPIGDQRPAARRLAAASIDPSVQEAIDDLQQKAKRRRVEEANEDCQGEQPQSTPTVLSPTLKDEVRDLNTSGPILHISAPVTARQYRFEHASAQATSSFFPPYMDNAIRRDTVNLNGVFTTTAAVTMVFQKIPSKRKIAR